LKFLIKLLLVMSEVGGLELELSVTDEVSPHRNELIDGVVRVCVKIPLYTPIKVLSCQVELTPQNYDSRFIFVCRPTPQ
jgi:hypothetical protein